MQTHELATQAPNAADDEIVTEGTGAETGDIIDTAVDALETMRRAIVGPVSITQTLRVLLKASTITQDDSAPAGEGIRVDKLMISRKKDAAGRIGVLRHLLDNLLTRMDSTQEQFNLTTFLTTGESLGQTLTPYMEALDDEVVNLTESYASANCDIEYNEQQAIIQLTILVPVSPAAAANTISLVSNYLNRRETHVNVHAGIAWSTDELDAATSLALMGDVSAALSTLNVYDETLIDNSGATLAWYTDFQGRASSGEATADSEEADNDA